MKEEIRKLEQDIGYEIDKAIDRIIDDGHSSMSKYLGKIARLNYRLTSLELPVYHVDCNLIDGKWRLVFYFSIPENIEAGSRPISRTSDELVFV